MVSVDPDAPAPRDKSAVVYKAASSYGDALSVWRSPEDVNSWIGAKFEYDSSRASALSETQRSNLAEVAIYSPERFFTDPSGICVDLARFGVETLQALSPILKPRYLMIEFDPAIVRGNILRRHWVTVFQRDGQIYVFADSKRPGHIAGPYSSVEDFISEYGKLRGRVIVSHKELESYKRRARIQAPRRPRADAPRSTPDPLRRASRIVEQ